VVGDDEMRWDGVDGQCWCDVGKVL